MNIQARKKGAKTNFGYANKMNYAVNLALLDWYGEGRTKTKESYNAKFKGVFSPYLKSIGIKNLELVTHDVMQGYADDLNERIAGKCISIGTAHNYLSAANCVMRAIRVDDSIFLSPGDSFGPRNQIRTEPPVGADWDQINLVYAHLVSHGNYSLAAMIILTRLIGLRAMEASLFSLRSALLEIKRYGELSVIYGTKGGLIRTFKVGADVYNRLEILLADIHIDRVIPDELEFRQWYKRGHSQLLTLSKVQAISSTFREFRAAYACDRYFQITGKLAPCYLGGVIVSPERDRKARIQISSELGHSRPQAAGPYIGTARRTKGIVE